MKPSREPPVGLERAFWWKQRTEAEKDEQARKEARQMLQKSDSKFERENNR